MADDFARRLAELNSVAEVMTLAIARERASANYYELALKKAATAAAKKAFSLLLEQEREHEKIMRAELSVVRSEIEKMRTGSKR